jgi:hypothetical protein
MIGVASAFRLRSIMRIGIALALCPLAAGTASTDTSVFPTGV